VSRLSSTVNLHAVPRLPPSFTSRNIIHCHSPPMLTHNLNYDTPAHTFATEKKAPFTISHTFSLRRCRCQPRVYEMVALLAAKMRLLAEMAMTRYAVTPLLARASHGCCVTVTSGAFILLAGCYVVTFVVEPRCCRA